MERRERKKILKRVQNGEKKILWDRQNELEEEKQEGNSFMTKENPFISKGRAEYLAL